jgi:hypothetical protein
MALRNSDSKQASHYRLRRIFRRLAIACLPAAVATASVAAFGESGPLRVQWKTELSSPKATATTNQAEAALLALCGPADTALMDVAALVAKRQLDGAHNLTADELAFALRAAGDPHVWPKAWSLSGTNLDDADVLSRLKTFMSSTRTLGSRGSHASADLSASRSMDQPRRRDARPSFRRSSRFAWTSSSSENSSELSFWRPNSLDVLRRSTRHLARASVGHCVHRSQASSGSHDFRGAKATERVCPGACSWRRSGARSHGSCRCNVANDQRGASGRRSTTVDSRSSARCCRAGSFRRNEEGANRWA